MNSNFSKIIDELRAAKEFNDEENDMDDNILSVLELYDSLDRGIYNALEDDETAELSGYNKDKIASRAMINVLENISKGVT